MLSVAGGVDPGDFLTRPTPAAPGRGFLRRPQRKGPTGGLGRTTREITRVTFVRAGEMVSVRGARTWVARQKDPLYDWRSPRQIAEGFRQGITSG